MFCAHEAICDARSAACSCASSRPCIAWARRAAGACPRGGRRAGPGAVLRCVCVVLRARAERPEGAADEAYWIERLSGPIKTLESADPSPLPRAPNLRRPAARSAARVRGSPSACASSGPRPGAASRSRCWRSFRCGWPRLTGHRDLIVALPAAGQAAAGAEAPVGHAMHVLPLRATVDPSAPFAAHLTAAAAGLREALGHRQVTLGSLVRQLNVPFDPSRIPLCPVCVNVEEALPRLDFGPLEAGAERVPRPFETFELAVNAVSAPHGDGAMIEWSYSDGAVRRSTVRRWMHELETPRRRTVSASGDAARDLALLGPDERTLLGRLNATDRAVEDSRCTRASPPRRRQRPRHVAVRFAGTDLTYRRARAAGEPAVSSLRRSEVRAGDCVGVCLERSEQLADRAAGRSSSAARPTCRWIRRYPAARLAMMAEDAAGAAGRHRERRRERRPRRAVLRLAAAISSARSWRTNRTKIPPSTVGGAERAYVLFTSGSTGRPRASRSRTARW